MITEEIIHEKLKSSFNQGIHTRIINPGVFQIFLPYYHEDGDMVDIYLSTVNDRLILTDFWQTLMRLSYYTELDWNSRKKLFDYILDSYNVHNSNGKLEITFTDIDELFPNIMELITVITKVSDISFLKQERIKNMFYDYFDQFMNEEIANRLHCTVTKDYVPTIPDINSDYPAPYAILRPNEQPILFFPILNEDRCKEAAMTLLYYKTKNFSNKSVAVFNDFSDISAKTSGKLVDLTTRPFSNFDTNKNNIIGRTQEELTVN
jgi:Domain of unknown function DUF1828